MYKAAMETNPQAVQDRLASLKKLYEKNGLQYTDEIGKEEIVAEMTNTFEPNVNKIAYGNPNLADKVLSGIRTAKAQVQTALSSPYTNNRTGVQMTYAQLNKAEGLWNNALRQAAENKGNASGENGVTRYSPIEYDNNGNAYVRIENQVLDGVPRNQWGKAITKWFNQNIQGKEFKAQSDGDTLKATRKFTNEYSNSNDTRKIYGTPEYDAKMNLAGNIDEGFIISRKVADAPDDTNFDGTLKHGNFAKDGWDYRALNFEYKGKKYTGILNVAKNPNAHAPYDITDIKEVESPSYEQTVKDSGSRINDSTSLNNSIRENEPIVKNSLKESAGDAQTKSDNFKK